MIKKKLCLLGPFGVGKTSLIRKYVLNVFSDDYLSSVGVKVDKKEIVLETGEPVVLVIWDLEGKDDYRTVADTYLRGMSGYFLVADGTRKETLTEARRIRDSLSPLFTGLSSMLLLNKTDLGSSWRVDPGDYADFRTLGIETAETSAKDGTGIEQSFIRIASAMSRRGHV